MSHANYRFSVTIHSDDLAVIGCLRAISKAAQKTGNNNIPWGGTKDRDWKQDGHKVTFHFSSENYRDGFIALAKEILRDSLWGEVSRSDDDPATPQN
ncbi:MAG TPA: hypothetical protein VFA75_08070 [Nevskia sp.]|nr:hypothetical protein [Nevskia sp.]